MSTLLFNLVLNEVLEEVGIVWRRRSYGADMGSFLGKERLTHVAFADDCTLEARSWLSLKRMILQRSIAEKRSEPSSFQMPGPEESHELDSARERAACRRLRNYLLPEEEVRHTE